MMLIENRILRRPKYRKASCAYQCHIALSSRYLPQEAFSNPHYVQQLIAPRAS
jgi:hypothetical protein